MDKKTFVVTSPSNGSVIAELAYMGYDETIDAIEQADKAFISWKDLLPQERAKILERWYDLINSHQDEIATIMHNEQGKPVEEALGEISYGNSFIKYYAQEVLRVFGEVSPTFKKDQWFMNVLEPIGVVGAITPWNFPCAMITKKIAPALASGCSVVLKPSEETPLTAIKIRELALEAGVPPEVFSIVYGDFKEIGRALVDSSKIKMISFTGSIEVGKYLMQASAATVKKLVLELGGNAPCIVCADAELELAAKKIAQGKFRNAGQACSSPNRIFVHQSVLAKFIELLIKEIDHNRYIIGPLINLKAKEKAQKLVDEALSSGAEILFKCQVPLGQTAELYFAPIIIAKLTDEMNLVKDEAFAPIFSILSFQDNQEVIARANHTKYGLAAYLFSSDLKQSLEIMRKLNFGVIGINETIIGADLTVHGGFNESGLGREGGKLGLMEYYENKFVIF
jgi:acyl-CoA reductase-like NAD-dependent aldehyde dehydrogenase